MSINRVLKTRSQPPLL